MRPDRGFAVATDFFDHQDRARRSTGRLVLLFVLAASALGLWGLLTQAPDSAAGRLAAGALAVGVEYDEGGFDKESGQGRKSDDACVTALCVPPEHRRKALVAGAMLGTLPDLDVFIDFGDAVRNFTYHRGFSHSLFVLPGVAVLIWMALRRWWAPVRAAPRPWLIAILLALITHPLLDAHTAYGTQLLWPLAPTPTSWSTLFIIDPLYTLPLLAGVTVIALRGVRPRAGRRVCDELCR